jgi:hypothetical protein
MQTLRSDADIAAILAVTFLLDVAAAVLWALFAK